MGQPAVGEPTRARAPKGKRAEPTPAVEPCRADNDPAELEALFDSIVTGKPVAPPAPPAPVAVPDAQPQAVPAPNQLISRIGQLTRSLHDTLKELGYDKMLQQAASAIPDAKERLSYVAQMTEQAASRVLNATDAARPIQDRIGGEAGRLAQRWDALYANKLSVEDFKVLAAETRNYLSAVPGQTREVNAQLMEIMMAQDFQDLTGQVIRRITDVAHSLETQLVQLLLEHKTAEGRGDVGLLNGPAMNRDGRTDVVKSQDEVDDLLDSLGF